MVNFKLGNVMRRDDFSSCHAQCAERVSHRIVLERWARNPKL